MSFDVSFLSKINSSHITPFPFPYTIIDDAFDNDVLNQFISNFPNQEFSNCPESSFSRKTMIFGSDPFNHFVDNNIFWQSFIDFVQGNIFKKTIISHFKNYIDEYAKEKLLEESIETQIDLTRAGKGYQRSCHLDRRHHVISMFLYLNSNQDEDYQGSGGDFLVYTHKSSFGKDKLYDKFPPNEDIKIEKQIETKKNRFLLFLNTPNSYHGVTPIIQSNGYRKFIYIALNTKSDLDIWENTIVQSEDRRQAFLNE